MAKERLERFEYDFIPGVPVPIEPEENPERKGSWSTHSITRRERPGQVLEPYEIEVGELYHVVNGDLNSDKLVEAIREPYQTESGITCFRGKMVGKDQYPPSIQHTREYSLESNAVIRDRITGKWDNRSYILKGEPNPNNMYVWNKHDYIRTSEDYAAAPIEDSTSEEGGRRIRIGQVASPRDLKIGVTYESKHEGQEERDYKFEVTGAPYRKDGRLVIDVERKFKDNSVPTTLDLGDHGVVPAWKFRLPIVEKTEPSPSPIKPVVAGLLGRVKFARR